MIKLPPLIDACDDESSEIAPVPWRVTLPCLIENKLLVVR